MNRPLPRDRPFSVLVNPDGRTDGYTKVLTANTTASIITVALDANVVAQARKLVCDFSIKLGAADAGINFRPNGLDQGNAVHVIWFAGGPSTVSLNSPNLPLGSPNDANTNLISGRFEFEVQTGRSFRQFHAHSASWCTTTPRAERQSLVSGFWADTSTALTSFNIYCNGGVANMLIGSTLAAYLEG